MSQEESLQDFAIVGGGLAGSLMASRLRSSNPSSKILLVDAAPSLGGRARSISWETKEWVPSPELVSEKLYNFASNAFLSAAAADDSLIFPEFKRNSLGILIQNKLVPFTSLQDKDSKIPKTLGGLPAQKQWLNLWGKIFEKEQEERKTFSKTFGLTQKDALAPYWKLVAYYLGLSTWQNAEPRALKERCEYTSSLGSSEFLGKLQKLFFMDENNKNFTLRLNEKVVSGALKDNIWHLKTNQGSFTAKHLIVAQSPWEALMWLNRKNLPKPLLQMALRSKPTSLVTLTKKIISTPENLPDEVIVASESTLTHKSNNSLCFTYSLDYESSINTQEVTKAIKALRRAAIKTQKFFEGLELEEESLALHPVAWGASAQSKDSDFLGKLVDYSYFTENLLFCGESYGRSYRPDENIIKSVLACASYCAQHKLGS